ncbi:hypothetical protein LEP1GSC050_2281 [Leptospira broomii serovar Hurstbridge str. 5399]|uniref:Uncharacterized protein n=1 Tax=Leptospira broomii serovar Hurstbridge str. 5399 TaxID=1049789 RepID=T0F037_9LEPT|nr:hypothetical protein [Leptospira broomii]EQA44515.1 hypothetical protein LEP1GSC050_2281 [Leptospira broomii serovar Hurstbridge str. 5399]
MPRTVLLIFSIYACICTCASRYYTKLPQGKPEIPKVDRSLRIAYIGFHTFRASTFKNPDGTVAFEALTEPDLRTLKNPSIGIFPSTVDLKSTGIRKDIPPERVQSFVKAYLSETGPSGIRELEKFLDIKKESQSYVYSLKILPFDYYIVGIHTPPLENSSRIFWNFVTLISELVSIASLGILPSYETFEASTTVIFFDANLNRLKELHYNNNYTVLRALWATANPPECKIGNLSCLGMFSPTIRANQPIVFEGMIPRINADIVESLRTLK